MWFSAIGYIMMLTLSQLAMSLTATAQPVGKLPRIGVLSPEPPPTATAPSVALDAFRQSLRALGYVEEQTILLEYRYGPPVVQGQKLAVEIVSANDPCID